MRFYNPEKQILVMLFAQLTEQAEQDGVSPAEVFSQAVLRMTSRHRGDLRLPDVLIDPSRTVQERYDWLCGQVDEFQQTESMRRAEWRMATEQAGCAALDRLLDDPDLAKTCRLLREDPDTILLATQVSESFVEGFRLQGARLQGTLDAPILVSSIELAPSLTGGLTLMAMSMEGEVQVTFACAEEVTLFYDYTIPSDPISVLLIPPVRLAYGLYKLLQKALREKKTTLTEAEQQLLPLALAATIFCGKSDSIALAEELAADCGNEWLSRVHYLFPVAVKALRECAIAADDQTALQLLRPMQKCSKVRECMRAVRRFGAHCESAAGEKLVCTALAKLKAAASVYPPSPLSGEGSAAYPLAVETVDRVMLERGYTGAWPHYSKVHVLPSRRLYCVGGVYPVVAGAGRRIVSTVDCATFLQGETLCVRFASGSVLLKKKESGEHFAGSESAAFSDKGYRRLSQFAAGLALREEDRPEMLDLAQTAVCAAKSAELDGMEAEERLRVVHASRRPLWVALLLWFCVGLLFGIGAGLLAWLVSGVCAWMGVMSIGGYIPLKIGVIVATCVGLVMATLTILGRRKL